MARKILLTLLAVVFISSLLVLPSFAAVSTQEPIETLEGYALPTYNAYYETVTGQSGTIYIGDEWLPTTDEMTTYYWENTQTTYPSTLYQSLNTTTLNAGINSIRATVQNGVVFYTSGSSSDDFYVGYRQFVYGAETTHFATGISTGYLTALSDNAHILVRADTRYSSSATVSIHSYTVVDNQITSTDVVSMDIPADTFDVADITPLLSTINADIFQIRVSGVLYEGRCDILYSGYAESPLYVDFAVRDETDIIEIRNVSYENFNLLSWLSTAVGGVFSARVFKLGNIDVSLGTLVAVPVSLWVTIAFLKKFAGG